MVSVCEASEVERLRLRTHELQERHDQEMAALRKENKDLVRSRDFFMSLWWERHPLIADRDLTIADRMKMRPVRDRLTRELLAEFDAMTAGT